LNAQAAADGSPEGHDGRSAGVHQALGEDHVVGSVGQDDESFFDEHIRGLECGLNIRMQRGLVSDDLQLDPVRQADLAREVRGTDGLIRRIATRGVGQQEVPFGIDVVEERFLAPVQIDAAHRDRHHLGAACLEGARIFLEGFVLTGAYDEA